MTNSAERRTAELWRLNYSQLEPELTSRPIGVYGTDILMRLGKVIPFPKSENQGPAYRRVIAKNPGEIDVTMVSANPVTLVAALDQEELGGCLKFQEGVLVTSEGGRKLGGPKAVTLALGLERGVNARLAFMNETETLYIVRDGLEVPRTEAKRPKVQEQEAIKELDKILGH